MEILGDRFVPVYRSKVKLHFCGSSRAKDGNVRAALLDRFGPVSSKETYVPTGKRGQPLKMRQRTVPGPLWGISGHMFSALAVVAYAWEMNSSGLSKSGDAG